jgi:hypothetical protein
LPSAGSAPGQAAAAVDTPPARVQPLFIGSDILHGDIKPAPSSSLLLSYRLPYYILKILLFYKTFYNRICRKVLIKVIDYTLTTHLYK